jgi:hypothetical protein
MAATTASAPNLTQPGCQTAFHSAQSGKTWLSRNKHASSSNIVFAFLSTPPSRISLLFVSEGVGRIFASSLEAVKVSSGPQPPAELALHIGPTFSLAQGPPASERRPICALHDPKPRDGTCPHVEPSIVWSANSAARRQSSPATLLASPARLLSAGDRCILNSSCWLRSRNSRGDRPLPLLTPAGVGRRHHPC